MPDSSRICWRRSWLALSAGLVLIWTSGCGSSLGTVSGKVTVDDKPVEGDVIFIGDGTSRPGSISPDGSYKIDKLKPGEYKVVVKGLLKTAFEKPKEVSKEKKADLPAIEGKASAIGTGERPPEKYGDEKTTPLKITVAAGSQTQDLKLSK